MNFLSFNAVSISRREFQRELRDEMPAALETMIGGKTDSLCDHKKWADGARAYNELITAWHGIVDTSHETGHHGSQATMDL